MIYYIVAWLAFQCPGGGAFKGLVPKSMRPLVCEQKSANALYASESEAMAKLRELGPSADLSICRESKGLMRCEPVKISWEPISSEAQ